MLSFKPTSSLSFTFIKDTVQFFFTFFHKGGVICLSEVINISAINLDSSLCFIYKEILWEIGLCDCGNQKFYNLQSIRYKAETQENQRYNSYQVQKSEHQGIQWFKS